jgi:hypothetical protein
MYYTHHRMQRTSMTARWFATAAALATLLSLPSCGPKTASGPSGSGKPRRPPPKPGESITHTIMCSCKVCEPDSCCRELEQEQPGIAEGCADGYDFSKCEMAVSSCDSRCFQHRWRTRVDKGCAASRPKTCCDDQ